MNLKFNLKPLIRQQKNVKSFLKPPILKGDKRTTFSHATLWWCTEICDKKVRFKRKINSKLKLPTVNYKHENYRIKKRLPLLKIKQNVKFRKRYSRNFLRFK